MHALTADAKHPNVSRAGFKKCNTARSPETRPILAPIMADTQFLQPIAPGLTRVTFSAYVSPIRENRCAAAMENSMSNEEVGFSVDGHVATVELRRPPNNFLDIDLIASLASVLEELDDDSDVRA